MGKPDAPEALLVAWLRCGNQFASYAYIYTIVIYRGYKGLYMNGITYPCSNYKFYEFKNMFRLVCETTDPPHYFA